MSRYEKLSVVQLKHVLNVKMESFSKEKRAHINKQVNGVEKSELAKIVQEHVDEADIDKLLLKPNPDSNTSKKKEEKKSKTMVGGGVGGGKTNEPTPQQLRQNAQIMRSNPNLVKKQNPQLAGYTNQQILELADQYEKLAENPEMMKQMKDIMENTTEEERKEMQKFQEEMKASGISPPAPGATPSDDQIDKMTKMLKKNPTVFKKIVKNSGMLKGQTDAQVDGWIDQLKDMDESTVKGILSSLKYLEPLKELYQKADKMTYGCAKYILGFIVIILLYYLLLGLWWLLKLIWWAVASVITLVVGGGEQKLSASVADLSTADVPVASTASVAGDAAKAGDEFEF